MWKTTLSPTEFFVGSDLPIQLLLDHIDSKCLIISDETVRDLYALSLAEKIGTNLLTVSRGEQAKTWQEAEKVIQEMLRLKADKTTTLIAVGGGSITDFVGFVASIYMRGIPHLFIPTTLLGMVDASIGGKTALNFAHAKNLIGSFYPPKIVFADLKRLDTLPQKEWLNGTAEILKLGLIADRAIWEMQDPLSSIEKAIEGKINIVAQDPKDQSIRRILNFGHTIGHALEAVGDYTISHGEAVAIGCIVESYLSMILGYLDKQTFLKIREKYSTFPLYLPRNYNRSHMIQSLTHDKKNSQGEIHCVLIDEIGHAIPFNGRYTRSVTVEEIILALKWMETDFQ